MNQDEVIIASVPPTIKLLKLVNGEMIVSMVEEKRHEEGVLVLYNPYKLVFGEFSMLQKTALMFEEWLPAQIVAEQVCEILYDDILTMVDVNSSFLQSYTKMVLKRITLDAIANQQGSRLDESMKMSEDEAEELDNEELSEKMMDALKKHRDSFN